MAFAHPRKFLNIKYAKVNPEEAFFDFVSALNDGASDGVFQSFHIWIDFLSGKLRITSCISKCQRQNAVKSTRRIHP